MPPDQPPCRVLAIGIDPALIDVLTWLAVHHLSYVHNVPFLKEKGGPSISGENRPFVNIPEFCNPVFIVSGLNSGVISGS
jgi:hypothetical protein